MTRDIWLSILLFGLIGIGHLLSRTNGWYASYWYTDIILHIAAGTALGLLWLWGTRNHNMPFFITLISTAAFAVLGSFAWELWEFAGLQIVPHALIYIPNLPDSLGDISAGFVGGLLAVLIRRV